MDERMRGFVRQLLHQAIHSGVRALLWRLPTLLLILAIAAMIWSVWYWDLF